MNSFENGAADGHLETATSPHSEHITPVTGCAVLIPLAGPKGRAKSIARNRQLSTTV